MNKPGLASVLGLLLVCAALACDRPFIEVEPADIEVVSPDLSEVQIRRTMRLQVRSASSIAIDSLKVNGLRMARSASDDLFELDVDLGLGVNQLRVEVFSDNGALGLDTLTAVFLPPVFDIAEFRLPAARGGHTATRLANGDLLVVGGSVLPNQPAVSEAFIFDDEAPSTAPQVIEALHARTEHTADRLPDGRILIIGGSTAGQPSLAEQLVEIPELFDPETAEFREVPVRGDPVRRSGHVSILIPVREGSRVRVFVYLYGGYGDIRYRPTPRMGVRSDIRVFEFRNDSLVAAGPTFGPFIEAIADHSVAEVREAVGPDAEYLFAGSFFAEEDLYDSYAFEALFSTEIGIRIDDLDPLPEPRSGHASHMIAPGEVMIFGGRSFLANTAKSSMVVYESGVKRFFTFPPQASMLQPRWGHTATNWDEGRILLLGGFGFAGAGLTTSEWFELGSDPQGLLR